MIEYLKGDVTRPVCPGYLVHVCNNVGRFGAGVALAIRETYPEAARQYFRLWESYQYEKIPLGMNQYVEVTPTLTIVNMIAQDGLPSRTRRRPLDYKALRRCLSLLYHEILPTDVIHMPKIGTGYAGGRWEVIEEIIHDCLPGQRKIYVYQLV